MNKKVIVTITILLIISTVLFTYGYYLANVEGNGKNIDGKLAILNITFNEGEDINPSYLEPIYDSSKETKSYKKTFTIENNSSENSTVDSVYLILSKIDNELKSEFVKWELLNNGKVISSGNLSNAEINKEIKLTDYKEFISLDGEKEELEFRLWLSYSESVDQSAMLNKSLSGKLKIVANEIPENLFTNGDLRRGAYNWEPFIYDENEKAIKYESSNYQAFGLGNYIEVNPNGTYKESIEMKSSNTDASYTVGVFEYDTDKRQIVAPHFTYFPNTLTELAEDLKNGDTVVHLKDLSYWDTNTTTYLDRGFIFWNYKDNTGYEYPELTYSRNVYNDLYENENVNKENKTITLNKPWSKGTIGKGTKLSQCRNGNYYNYGIIYMSTITTSWQTYTNQISGIIDNGSTYLYTKFRPGTKYIRFLIFNNRDNTPNTTTYLKNISFKRID